jgi:hypothetical protein
MKASHERQLGCGLALLATVALCAAAGIDVVGYRVRTQNDKLVLIGDGRQASGVVCTPARNRGRPSVGERAHVDQ